MLPGGIPTSLGTGTPNLENGDPQDFSKILAEETGIQNGRVGRVLNLAGSSLIKPPVGNRSVITPGPASQKIQ